MDILEHFKEMIADDSAAVFSVDFAKKVITEFESMREENARLQSVIDEANAQDPYLFLSKEIGAVSYQKYGGYDFPLYARPIPAQQSPAVAVPDGDDGLLPIGAHDHPDCRVMYWSEQELRAIKDYAKRCIAAQKSPRITDQEYKTISSNTSEWSQRITEQDAREIEDFLVGDYKREYIGQGIEAWLRSACLALRNKLNKV